MYPHYKTTKKKLTLPWLIALGVFGLVILVGVLEFANVTHIFHKKSAPVTGSSYTKGEGNNTPDTTKNSTQTSTSTATGQPGDDKSATGGGTASALLTPTGDFVSNHHPNLSGSPAPNSIGSVCTTTPGAKCTITFTKDGTTKSLPVQVTDRGGSAYWNWKLQDIGITEGSWTVEARAALGGKTSTAADAMQLVVQS